MALPDADESEIAAKVLGDIAGEFGFDKTWADMTPTQRLVAKLTADEKIRVFSKTGRMAFESQTEDAHLSNEELLEVANGLVQMEILDRWNGDWQVGDPLFKVWIKNLPDAGS